uniref:AIG1-type G domain-containing protein n=1 Tax=Crocodylus porosus TaxID=8502 RepID=A0A7M4G394_CROPO
QADPHKLIRAENQTYGENWSREKRHWNTILGKRVFNSRAGAKSVAETCAKARCTWKGKKVVVIDTPAFYDTTDSDRDPSQEISHCIQLSSPGPHALVLVVQLGYCSEKDKKSVEKVQEIFGEAALKHAIVLFTRKEELADDPLSEYIGALGKADLQQLIQACGNRYCAFSKEGNVTSYNVQLAKRNTYRHVPNLCTFFAGKVGC